MFYLVFLRMQLAQLKVSVHIFVSVTFECLIISILLVY